jgi:hypothetical protein
MGKAGSFALRVILPGVIAGIFLLGIGAYGREGSPEGSDVGRPDVIVVDTLKAHGRLERPPVEFPHDLHTQTLEKKQKDCTVCHLPEKNRLSLKFQRIEDGSKQETTDIYHARCIECHRETAASSEKSGPVTCGECHRESPRYQSSRVPIPFDKSLHYRHTKANENKCELCHHEYDEQSKQLVVAKGKEGSCYYCHKEVTSGNRVSGREASHIGCLDCHRKTLAAKKKSGPVTCAGCHDPEEQSLIEKVKDVPRLDRKQPDIVLLKGEKEVLEPKGRMKLVPFDHKAHEAANDTCRVCHHEAMSACNTCHTRQGSKEGKWVTLERAMHQRDAEESCTGCHNRTKAAESCAGCHTFLKPGTMDSSGCVACHSAPVPDSKEKLTPEQEIHTARAILESRSPVKPEFADPDPAAIPEKVTIRVLSHEYEPVEFPHRKIAATLLKNSSANRIAGYFHNSQMTICQGCHHNSPASLTPPTCRSCHGKPFNEANPKVPGLLGAYHQQCMGCHQAMNIEKPMGCTECHKEKS